MPFHLYHISCRSRAINNWENLLKIPILSFRALYHSLETMHEMELYVNVLVRTCVFVTLKFMIIMHLVKLLLLLLFSYLFLYGDDDDDDNDYVSSVCHDFF